MYLSILGHHWAGALLTTKLQIFSTAFLPLSLILYLSNWPTTLDKTWDSVYVSMSFDQQRSYPKGWRITHWAEWRIYASINYPSLVQIMACRLEGAKTLFAPMLECCLLDTWEQTSVKFQSKFKHFHRRKYVEICRLRNVVHFVSASMCKLY